MRSLEFNIPSSRMLEKHKYSESYNYHMLNILRGLSPDILKLHLYPFPLEMWVGGKRTKPHEPTSSR